jgi:hypothetical protein
VEGEVTTTYDTRYTRPSVIGNRSQLVGRNSISTSYHRVPKITERIAPEFFSEKDVRLHPQIRQAHTKRIITSAPSSRSEALLSTSPGISKTTVGGWIGLGCDLAPGTRAWIQDSHRIETIDSLLMGIRARALTFHLVPIESQPGKVPP